MTLTEEPTAISAQSADFAESNLRNRLAKKTLDDDSSNEKSIESLLDSSLNSRLDTFLADLDRRLDTLEKTAHEKLKSLPEAMNSAYQSLSKLRADVVAGNSTIDWLDGSNLSLLEAKLADLEHGVASWAGEHAEQLQQSVQSALSVAKNRLLTYEELPVPWRENPYILRGYRFCKTYKDCLYSVVQLHNETCNIWTHLIGFLVMAGIGFWHYPSTRSFLEANSNADIFFMSVFLVAACKCLVLSAVWHTFSGISHLEAKQSFACFDYTGIALLIGASIMTTEYTALYCQETPRNIYLACTALFGAGGAIFTWTPQFDKPEHRPTRILFFVSFAIAGVVGFFHAAYYHGLGATFAFYLPVLKSLLCYSAGVVVYGLLIPERWCPGGIFDYFCMSHNIWHVAVFGGIYFHYTATVKLLEGAKSFSCPI